MEPKKVFTDAGLLSGGRTLLGGMWGFCLVDENDEVVTLQSGLMVPRDHEIATVEINLVETYAVLLALEYTVAQWPGWSGEVLLDNNNARKRFCEPSPWGGVPDAIRLRCHAALKRCGPLRFTLLAGHPTPADLAQGFRVRSSGNPYPVSRHNVAVDLACCQERDAWQAVHDPRKAKKTTPAPLALQGSL